MAEWGKGCTRLAANNDDYDDDYDYDDGYDYDDDYDDVDDDVDDDHDDYDDDDDWILTTRQSGESDEYFHDVLYFDNK